MPFSFLKSRIGNSFKTEREIWLEEATSDSTTEDLTQLIIQGERYIQPYLTTEESIAFESKFGSVSDSSEISSENILEVLSNGHSMTSQLARESISQVLMSVLKVHAQFPFTVQKQSLNAAGLLRATVLLTSKSSQIFGMEAALFDGRIRRVVRRVRTQEDALRLLFWGLSAVGSADVVDVPCNVQESDILDVLGVVQARHPPPTETIAPLTRDDLQVLANRFAANIPALRVRNKIDQRVMAQWVEFMITSTNGEENNIEIPDSVDFEQFSEYARKTGMLETLATIFGRVFLQ